MPPSRYAGSVSRSGSHGNGLHLAGGANFLRPFLQRVRLLMRRFSDAGTHDTSHALRRPASEKRQGTKSRWGIVGGAATMGISPREVRIRHEMFEMVMARVSAIACGYEDANDL